MNNIFFYDFTVGKIAICEEDGKICKIGFFEDFLTEKADLLETPLIKRTAKELSEFFEGKRKGFDIPSLIKGTPFQKTVWQIISAIPYGSTLSYGDIARKIFIRGGSQSVGGACRKNPLLFLIPCHRVTASGGRLGGYGGHTEIKIRLLSMEAEASGKAYTLVNPLPF